MQKLLLIANEKGIISSEVFPGLWLDKAELLISFPFVSELFKFPSSPSSSALSVPLWFFYHSDVTGFDITGNLAEVLATLQQGLATEKHLNFVGKISNIPTA